MCDDEVDLTESEKKVLAVLGKLHISPSKNVSEKTIKKKLPSTYHSELSNTIKSLHSKGLLRYYRKENYALTKEGKKIAEELAAKLITDIYSDLRILLVL
jgi:Mn-dependent DtxR family transcriptional regulator